MGPKLYRVNLNKASNRLDQFEQKQKHRRVMALGFYFVVILAITALAIFKSVKTQAVIDGYRGELAKIEEEISSLEASAEYLSPEDIFALAELAQTRMTWTEKLDVLGKILPRDVAVTELSYDNLTKTLMIKGISKVKPSMRDLDLVVSIIDLIKANKNFSKDFSDIKFSSSTRVKYSQQEFVEFEIACLVG